LPLSQRPGDRQHDRDAGDRSAEECGLGVPGTEDHREAEPDEADERPEPDPQDVATAGHGQRDAEDAGQTENREPGNGIARSLDGQYREVLGNSDDRDAAAHECHRGEAGPRGKPESPIIHAGAESPHR
jgi:hypothetical protein